MALRGHAQCPHHAGCDEQNTRRQHCVFQEAAGMSFAAFASACGLLPSEIVPDGRIRRCPTASHPRRKNGAYMLAEGWGWAQDWSAHAEPQIWQDGAGGKIDPGQLREMMALRAKELRAGQDRAAKQAETLLSECELATHAYLGNKGFPDELGLVDEEKRLLIPMRDCQDYRRVLSVQRITPEGDKRFLLGGRTKGAIYTLGGSKSRLTWLCEGYATGLSIRAACSLMAMPARIVVCFSSGNLVHVAGLIGGERYVIADHDESKTGEIAAGKTGLKWAMPDAVGTDANDLHQQQGLYSVAKLLQRARGGG